MRPYNQIGIQNALAVSTSAVALTLPAKTARHAIIYVAGSPVRWRADDTAPTAAIGMYAAAESWLEFMNEDADFADFLRRIQFISANGGAATLEVSFFD